MRHRGTARRRRAYCRTGAVGAPSGTRAPPVSLIGQTTTAVGGCPRPCEGITHRSQSSDRRFGCRDGTPPVSPNRDSAAGKASGWDGDWPCHGDGPARMNAARQAAGDCGPWTRSPGAASGRHRIGDPRVYPRVQFGYPTVRRRLFNARRLRRQICNALDAQGPSHGLATKSWGRPHNPSTRASRHRAGGLWLRRSPIAVSACTGAAP